MPGYYFNLPPESELTPDQRAALHHTGPIALQGAPGTGKTVVSLRRHMALTDAGRRTLLITYTTTLRTFLRKCCGQSHASQFVRTSLAGKPHIGEKFDEVIVDEAQDLGGPYYAALIHKGAVSYGADDSQILYPEQASRQAELRARFPSNREFVLERTFRNTREILEVAQVACPEAYIPAATLESAKVANEKPVLLLCTAPGRARRDAAQHELIGKIITDLASDTHNVAVLVPWANQVQYFADLLHAQFPHRSYYYDNDDVFPDGATELNNIHITTFKSSKGLEVDTVILPYFEVLNKVADAPKAWHLSWKDYYVALTRARSNLIMISNKPMPHFSHVAEIEKVP